MLDRIIEKKQESPKCSQENLPRWDDDIGSKALQLRSQSTNKDTCLRMRPAQGYRQLDVLSHEGSDRGQVVEDKFQYRVPCRPGITN